MDFEEWWQEKGAISKARFTDDIALEAWNASAEANKPRWIPVSERLPDKEEIYPVIMEGCNLWFTRRFENDKFECNEDENPTHWLELPEMPE